MPALPWNMSLTAAASKSFFLSMRELKAECTASSSLSIFSLVSTASRLLPFSRLSRAFHSPGGTGELAAELRHRAVEGDPSHDRALPVLSGSLFFR